MPIFTRTYTHIAHARFVTLWENKLNNRHFYLVSKCRLSVPKYVRIYVCKIFFALFFLVAICGLISFKSFTCQQTNENAEIMTIHSSGVQTDVDSLTQIPLELAQICKKQNNIVWYIIRIAKLCVTPQVTRQFI